MNLPYSVAVAGLSRFLLRRISFYCHKMGSRARLQRAKSAGADQAAGGQGGRWGAEGTRGKDEAGSRAHVALGGQTPAARTAETTCHG